MMQFLFKILLFLIFNDNLSTRNTLKGVSIKFNVGEFYENMYGFRFVQDFELYPSL